MFSFNIFYFRSHRTHPINKNRVHNVNLINITWDQNGRGDLKIWVNKKFLKFYKVGISIVLIIIITV